MLPLYFKLINYWFMKLYTFCPMAKAHTRCQPPPPKFHWKTTLLTCIPLFSPLATSLCTVFWVLLLYFACCLAFSLYYLHDQVNQHLFFSFWLIFLKSTSSISCHKRWQFCLFLQTILHLSPLLGAVSTPTIVFRFQLGSLPTLFRGPKALPSGMQGLQGVRTS